MSRAAVSPAGADALRQDDGFIRAAYRRALIPGMLSILSGNLNILADGVLVGQKLGSGGLAAINLCVPVYLFLCVVGSLLVSGACIQASKAIGRGDGERGTLLCRTAVWSCAAASLLITALGLLFLNPLAAAICPDPALRGMVTDYIRVTLIGALPKILLYVPFWFLRLDGRNSLVTVCMTVMGAGNILLDVWFIFGLNLGVAGAAWASVLATAAACALGLFWLCGRGSGFPLGRGFVRDGKTWGGILRDGSPSALNNLLQSVRLLLVNGLLLSHGGEELVAVFSVLNCVSAFSLCVIDGAPQAGSAMMGIYCGERDNGSIRLLFRRELVSGTGYLLLFAAITLACSGAIQGAYALPEPLLFPLLLLAAGYLPALLLGTLIAYYNVSGHAALASLLIALRALVFAVASLWLLLGLGASPWWFFPLSEALTLCVWLLCAAFGRRAGRCLSPFLFLDLTFEEEGRVLNFSVDGSDGSICSASERITEFCAQNGMSPKQVMRISLAIEELLTVIVARNGRPIPFDIKAFALPDHMGIRVRYGGVDFDPFSRRSYPADSGGFDENMGVRMIAGMADRVVYQRTFGASSLQIFV